jgi:hypothetical protein
LNLSSSFKYLPSLKILCEETAGQYDYKKEYKEEDYKKLFEIYKNSLIHLFRNLKQKNHTFVNFKEFFNEGNLSALFNKMARDFEQHGRNSVHRKSNQIDKMVKIGGGIFLVTLGIIAFLIIDQGNKIETVGEKINQINNKLKNNIIVGSEDTNQGVSQSPSNSPVVSQNLQGDKHLPSLLGHRECPPCALVF